MTQKDFDRLPLVLKPAHLKEIFGLSNEGLKALRLQNPEIVVRQCGKREFQFSKEVVAKLARLRYE